MSCSQFDLKAYFLGEPDAAGRGAVEEHLKACTACREELDRLRLTGAALASVLDEEMPHRIAFVSDKIFEPRGWARFWGSAPRLGFASAAMLSLAILVHGFIRQVPSGSPAGVDTAAIEARIEREVAGRLPTVVEKAVAEATAAQAVRTAELVAAVDKKVERQRQSGILAWENVETLQKTVNVGMVSDARLRVGGGQ
jgi:hypothetical protein